jgi:hypothetical protein
MQITVPFYIRDLNIGWLWYLQGILAPICLEYKTTTIHVNKKICND